MKRAFGNVTVDQDTYEVTIPEAYVTLYKGGDPVVAMGQLINLDDDLRRAIEWLAPHVRLRAVR